MQAHEKLFEVGGTTVFTKGQDAEGTDCRERDNMAATRREDGKWRMGFPSPADSRKLGERHS